MLRIDNKQLPERASKPTDIIANEYFIESMYINNLEFKILKVSIYTVDICYPYAQTFNKKKLVRDRRFFSKLLDILETNVSVDKIIMSDSIITIVHRKSPLPRLNTITYTLTK